LPKKIKKAEHTTATKQYSGFGLEFKDGFVLAEFRRTPKDSEF
jgi:hypothetical protein